ncbi:IQ and ubiquitin-like domain-containing protein [Echinococcus granulosus]|uniref:IQ and ubiquitin-like domain-containing protein n=1 Tax=Echinococcus granulosus TaxID=6210 RepID=W6UTY7_ECHGR|nr:IQ and ubiquitin-like domain-containing protein [Echinococcus granulosus]EUB64763.1 IQ and ubiquitin-like domain-containing protein [Echinococcus granulosus]
MNNPDSRAGVSLKPWCVVVRIKFPYNTIMKINDLPDGLPFDLLRRVLAEECSDNVKNIKLFYNNDLIRSGVTPKRLFKDLSVVPEIECRFKHPSQTTKIHLGRRICKLSRTDDITVYVYKGDEKLKDRQPDNLEVNLVKKTFLGGYRRKSDQVLFHHATSQTAPKPPEDSPIPLFSRETQTYAVKHEEQETLHQATTAMTKPGFFVTNINDKEITPGPYETADEYRTRLNRCAIVIQRHVRCWLAKRRVARLRTLRDEYYKFVKEEERVYLQEKANGLDLDYKRRATPKTRYDIDRLFNALEEWHVNKVNNAYRNSSTLVIRKANMGLVLDKEVEFIKKITQKQIELSDYGKMREQEHFIEKAASTVCWRDMKGRGPVEKDTPYTLFGKSLLTLYEDLKSSSLSKTERMDLLLTVKKLAGKYPSSLSCDIVMLAERETELMLRNIPVPMLTGLRQRILQRFIQFCKVPEYNPAVAPFLPIPDKNDPNARTKMWKDTHRCISCGGYLQIAKFGVSARAKHLDVCLFCWRQGNRGRDRVDLEPYRLILEDLQKSEAELIRKAHRNKKAELREMELVALDEADIYFLVNKIWNGRSALSGCSELGDLTLCRWKVTEPWSPWNTLLLTKKEADLHMKLNNIPSSLLYADTMLTRVRQRLVIGKNVFVRLCLIGRNMTREQLESTEKFRHPGDKNERPQMERRLCKSSGRPVYLLSAEQRHKSTFELPQVLLPVIKGERRMTDLGITSLQELWPI